MKTPGEFQPESNGHGEVPKLADLVELSDLRLSGHIDDRCELLDQAREIVGIETSRTKLAGVEIIKRALENSDSIEALQTGKNVVDVVFKGPEKSKRHSVKNSVRQIPMPKKHR